MKLQQSLLWQSSLEFPLVPSAAPLPVSNTDLKRAIGLYFNLGFIFNAGVAQTVANHNSLANAYVAEFPWILPVSAVNVVNFSLGINYTAAGTGGWSGNLNIILAPCNVDGLIDESQASRWHIGTIYENTTFLSVEDDFGRLITSNGSTFTQKMSQYNSSNPAAFGTFCWGYYFDNLTGVATGDTFTFTDAKLFIPGTVGGE